MPSESSAPSCFFNEKDTSGYKMKSYDSSANEQHWEITQERPSYEPYGSEYLQLTVTATHVSEGILRLKVYIEHMIIYSFSYFLRFLQQFSMITIFLKRLFIFISLSIH